MKYSAHWFMFVLSLTPCMAAPRFRIKYSQADSFPCINVISWNEKLTTQKNGSFSSRDATWKILVGQGKFSSVRMPFCPTSDYWFLKLVPGHIPSHTETYPHISRLWIECQENGQWSGKNKTVSSLISKLKITFRDSFLLSNVNSQSVGHGSHFFFL